MKVRFIESPTGVLGLGYFVGDEITVSNEQGKLLVDGGFAEASTPTEEKQVKEPDKEVMDGVQAPVKQYRKRGK